MVNESQFTYTWMQRIEIVQTLVRNLLYKGCVVVNERNELHHETKTKVNLTQAERYMYDLIRMKDGKTMLQLIKHFIIYPSQLRTIITAIENDPGISSNDDYRELSRMML